MQKTAGRWQDAKLCESRTKCKEVIKVFFVNLIMAAVGLGITSAELTIMLRTKFGASRMNHFEVNTIVFFNSPFLRRLSVLS